MESGKIKGRKKEREDVGDRKREEMCFRAREEFIARNSFGIGDK